MYLLRKTISVIDRCNGFLFWIVAGTIVLAAGLVFMDVILRYLFNFVTHFGYDLTIWLTAVIALAGGGYITKIREHIRIDIMYLKMSGKGKCVINMVVYATILLLAVIMIYYGFERVTFYYGKGSIAMSGFNIYIWIKWLIVPLSGSFLGLQAVSEALRDICFMATGRPLFPETMPPEATEPKITAEQK